MIITSWTPGKQPVMKEETAIEWRPGEKETTVVKLNTTKKD